MSSVIAVRRRTQTVLILAASAALAAALPGSTTSARPPSVAAVRQPAASDLPFIAVYRSNRNVAESIERAGGAVIANLPEINVVIASATRDTFDLELQQDSNFKSVVRDQLIDWLAQTGPPAISQHRVSSHAVQNPRQALFLDEQWNIRKVRADLAWDITEGDPEIKVAVLDSGICTHHPDLADKVDAEFSRSFIFPSFFEVDDAVAPACIGCPSWEDRNYHGTHVASIISSNNLGTASVAPRVRLRAIKVLNAEGNGTFAWTLLGLIYAANTGNHIISMSLGGLHARTFIGPPHPPTGDIPIPIGRTQLIAVMAQAITYARERGVLVVASAGNEGHNLDGADDGIALPCEAASGMCVGATTISDARADYSNHGRSLVQLMAPGGGEPVAPFPATDENTAVLGPCSEHSVPLPVCAGTHAYIFVAGTSQAVPHVSGAAALVASILRAQVGSKPGLWQRALVSTAEDLGPQGVDGEFSHGRLDILRALQRAGH